MAEHTLYGKRKLCYTEVTDFTNFQGIGRDPLYKRFDSVYSVIEHNIEPQYRDFLAHPIYSDEDQILWYVREWNNTPSAYKDLSDADKVRYAAIKEKTIAAYEKVRENLTGEDKQILTGALKNIDEDFMFCYDDKVVVVAWGMSPDSHKHVVKGAIIHDLKLQSNHKIRFIVGENGTLADKIVGIVSRPDGAILSQRDLPIVTPKKGYKFREWKPNPLGMKVNGPLHFTALYDEVPIDDVDDDVVVDDDVEKENVHVTFRAGEGGSLSGTTEYIIEKGTCLDTSQIPSAMPNNGYSFAGWNIQPDLQAIDEDTTFIAIFNRDQVTCRFVAGEHGSIEGTDCFILPQGSIFSYDNIPVIKAKQGYKFVGWNKSPIDYILNEDTIFIAQYEKELPWYKRVTGKGCLKWLLWFLLLILVLFLWSRLLRGCDIFGDSVVEPIPKRETPDGRIIDDNGPVKGIVGDDGKLPDNSVVAPIIGEDGEEPPIISNPGAPDIIANRLNIYFENANVNLKQFISDLSKIYSKNECQVIGFDKNVPMIQIRFPENMRDAIRESLNAKLPNYDFFIVDESIFTLEGDLRTNSANDGWHLEAIDVKEGWKITKGSPDITVAVVDDGIDATHDIFIGRIVSPYNVFTQNNRLSVGQGHGTHVAGLAVGSDKMFSEGVSGVAPKCKLMPIQVFDNGMCSFSSLTNGIMYAIHHGADVINVSIGPSCSGLDILPLPDQEKIARTQFKNEERVWKRIINVANKHNAIIVFAAGNESILAAIYPENRTNFTVNVAAVDRHIEGTDFTNYGRGSNISAPGEGILSSVPINDFDVKDGTSVAAPIVSGTIALMKSLKPDISVTDVLHILQATGMSVPGDMPPMIQVADALRALKTGVIPDANGNANNEIANPNAGDGGSWDNNPGNNPNPTNPEDDRGKIDPPTSENPNDGTDYDAIRKLIELYKKKISELEKLLPENK